MTAMPQPKVITIQPEFWALEWFNSTAATTPSPMRIRIAVPIISAPMMLNETPLLERESLGPRRDPEGDPNRGALRKSTQPAPVVAGGRSLVRGRASGAARRRRLRAGGGAAPVREAEPGRA